MPPSGGFPIACEAGGQLVVCTFGFKTLLTETQQRHHNCLRKESSLSSALAPWLDRPLRHTPLPMARSSSQGMPRPTCFGQLVSSDRRPFCYPLRLGPLCLRILMDKVTFPRFIPKRGTHPFNVSVRLVFGREGGSLGDASAWQSRCIGTCQVVFVDVRAGAYCNAATALLASEQGDEREDTVSCVEVTRHRERSLCCRPPH